MAIYRENGKVAEIFEKYGGAEKNTGSTEGQIAYFTYRIAELSKHLQVNRKDHSCRRTLLTLVGKRKKLLKYLERKNITRYRELLKELGIRG